MTSLSESIEAVAATEPLEPAPKKPVRKRRAATTSASKEKPAE
ncbi:hypothetical protein [Aeromonas phage T7-Ah]|uniref:Uncharacterized protein n=1 Tax=Aeromonas phage T7-Ah TaxID=2759196 RepID=A0A7S6L103_9CAUD|nr:hypothetical protein [Aeromonas phage T7-Ah]